MTARAAAPRRLYLVDGSGYIFRAYHALPPLSRKRDGMPTGAAAGFCNMLVKLREMAASDAAVSHMAIVFDAGRVTFRNEIYPAYKANRAETPEDLAPQFGFIRDAVRAFSLPCYEMPGYEADDVIATLARAARAQDIEVVIVSSDKDLMQLVDDGISMWDPIKNIPLGRDAVIEKFGVPPDKVVDVQALAGDATDNVPGVSGIGVKTAAQLISEFGDLDGLLERLDEIKQPKRREALVANADNARISRELVRLKDDVPLEYSFPAMQLAPLDHRALATFLDDMEFRSLRSRLDRLWPDIGGGEQAPPPAPASAVKRDGYRLVQTLADLEHCAARAREAGVIALDTETTGLDGTKADLVGISMAFGPGDACYIPLGHRTPGGALNLDGETLRQIPREQALAILRDLCADPAILKVGHNIKYDMLVLARYDVMIAPYDDTMLISYLLEAGLHGHGLDELCMLHFGHENISYQAVTGTGKKQISFAEVPLETARDYASEDADMTLRLWRLLKPQLRDKGLVALYERVERPLAAVVMHMERAGVQVDRAALNRLSAVFAERMAGLESQAHHLAGATFNLGSPKQLGEILFEKMGLPGGRRSKTGAWGTGAEVLEQLAEQGHELPRVLLEWRQAAKLKSTYADALVEQINPNTGRVHTSFALAATSTGRLSSSDPNLQNIPIRTEEGRKIRQAFVAPPGHVLLSADYSQIELRLLAHVADIEPLRQAFRDGVDIHALTASQVFGVPIAGMDPTVRRAAKAINFGIIYGMSAFGLASQLGIEQGEAQAYIRSYFERFPGIRAYMDRMKAQAHEKGYVETLFGRRCHLKDINEKNPALRAFQERAAINAPLQGAAADLIKKAMVALPASLAAAGLKTRMLLQVHDELLFEAPETEAQEAAALIKRVMEGVARLSVPLTVEVGQGANWDEAH